jgi:redox-sensitive bicupin YhaK (pirin superfamily)
VSAGGRLQPSTWRIAGPQRPERRRKHEEPSCNGTRLGTPALVLDVELAEGGEVTTPIPPELQGFAYVLEGEAAFGANGRRAKPPQLVLLGRGDELRVTDASRGTRFLLMAGQPYGEVPVFNGPYVD